MLPATGGGGRSVGGGGGGRGAVLDSATVNLKVHASKIDASKVLLSPGGKGKEYDSINAEPVDLSRGWVRVLAAAAAARTSNFPIAHYLVVVSSSLTYCVNLGARGERMSCSSSSCAFFVVVLLFGFSGFACLAILLFTGQGLCIMCVRVND